MARVIQQTIKTPLADEVLFGRLKNGGTVRVMVTTDDEGVKKLGFVFPEGPVLPRPERDIVEAGKKRVRAEPEVRRAKARRLKGEDGGDDPELDDDLVAPADADDD
jgi:ATP-dependent Clp protease ATP-binding subunit ClpA